jgi:hypothetical protein
MCECDDAAMSCAAVVYFACVRISTMEASIYDLPSMHTNLFQYFIKAPSLAALSIKLMVDRHTHGLSSAIKSRLVMHALSVFRTHCTEPLVTDS